MIDTQPKTTKRWHQRLTHWLETHWVSPAYGGWLLLGLTLFFFMAASNTMAGWLYVLSGVGLALLGVAALLPPRMLQGLTVQRSPIHPISAGDYLTIELRVDNPTHQPKSLLQVIDRLPTDLGKRPTHAIAAIPPQGHQTWIYTQPTEKRGLYRWQTLHLRTAAPLGLFWCQRDRTAKALAIVYPPVLPLAQCPLVDVLGQEQNTPFESDRQARAATEGMTRTLRPYRWGDPTRMIHWRSSARYGELRVRELEVYTGGQELVICLDSGSAWASPNDFEQAVTAATSIYFYATRHNLTVHLWTAATGRVYGNQPILEALAAIQPGPPVQAELPPTMAMLWLTPKASRVSHLPSGSRWMLWSSQLRDASDRPSLLKRGSRGLVIMPDQSLQLQLQAPLDREH